MSEYQQTTQTLIHFIDQHPSPYHVISGFCQQLTSSGFSTLSEADPWDLQPGHDYLVTRGQSSLIAFRVPEQNFDNFQIVASHSDSPAFRLKASPEISAENAYLKLNAEPYGGMLCAPWFDRPLGIAGRMAVRRQNAISSVLVALDHPLCLIPSLAIHMNREANNGKAIDMQKELLPLFGEISDKGKLETLLCETAGISPKDLLSWDLYLVNRVPGVIWGASDNFFSCARLDDLMCAWSSVQALMDGVNDRSVCIAAVFDHEEVGSRSMQGADSTFLSDVLERISFCLGKTRQQHLAAIAQSFMISADNAHSLHPNYPETADPVNRPLMNHGPVVKTAASQKYTSTALSAALFREICAGASVPCQTFFNHSNQKGGSTLGNLSNAHVSLHTVDIGMAQLAMHSPYETAGTRDTLYLVEALTAFYRTHIEARDDGFLLMS